MSMDYKIYTVERDGKTVKLKSSKLNVQGLLNIFSLFLDSILLLSDDGYVSKRERFRCPKLPNSKVTISGNGTILYSCSFGGKEYESGKAALVHSLLIHNTSKEL